MRNSILFSIIMPCYNSELYVSAAIDSVRNQQYDKWELLAINDGSTDNTLCIINEYSAVDSRIKVFSKPNGGYVSAVNYGLDRVEGDYFILLGSDDELDPELFSRINSCIEDIDLPDMIAFRTIKIIDGNMEGIDRITDFDSLSYMNNTSINEYCSMYPAQSHIFFVRDTSKCFKTSLLENLRYLGRYGFDADGIFSALFSHKAHSFMSIPIDGYYWTLRSDSLSAKTTIMMDFDRLSIWEVFLNELITIGINNVTDIEKDYILAPQRIGKKIIEEIEKMNNKTIKILNHTRRYSYFTAKKFHTYSTIKFHGVKRIRGLNRFFYIYTPTLWTICYRIRTTKFRKNLEK